MSKCKAVLDSQKVTEIRVNAKAQAREPKPAPVATPKQQST